MEAHGSSPLALATLRYSSRNKPQHSWLILLPASDSLSLLKPGMVA